MNSQPMRKRVRSQRKLLERQASIEAGGGNGGVAENGGTSSGGNGGSGTGGVGGSTCFEIGICSNVTANNNQKIQQN
jgi:hypothetical protein